MNFFEYIKSILSDIGSDFNSAEQDADNAWNDSGGFGSRRRGGAGIRAILWPQLVGAVLGLAIARVFKADFSGYMVLAVLFAIAAGTYKSVSFDKIALRHAIVRNMLIAVVCAAILWIVLKL